MLYNVIQIIMAYLSHNNILAKNELGCQKKKKKKILAKNNTCSGIVKKRN